MILVVSYDLKQNVESYSDFFDLLKSKDSWAHYIPSTWFVATDQSPKELSQDLIPHILSGDRIFVTELIPGYAGWLPRKAWDWIKKHSR